MQFCPKLLYNLTRRIAFLTAIPITIFTLLAWTSTRGSPIQFMMDAIANGLRDQYEEYADSLQFVTFKYIGGMGIGNMMFIYASTLGMSSFSRKRHVYFTNISFPLTKYFDLKSEDINDYKDYQGLSETRFGAYHQNLMDHVKKFENNSFQINGYLQSFKYFDNIKAKVLRHFTFKPKIKQTAQETLFTSICSKLNPNSSQTINCSDTVVAEKFFTEFKPTLVGIHVRRGDFLNLQHYGYTVADLNYFRNAIQYIQNELRNDTNVDKIIYVLLGNDRKWNKKLTEVVHEQFVVPPMNEAGVDFCILTLCDHIILTGGTYGWWAAYMTNGLKVYYKYAVKPKSSLASGFVSEDYFPPHWKGLL